MPNLQADEIALGILASDKREDYMPAIIPGGLFVSGVAAADMKDLLEEHNIKYILTTNSRRKEWPQHQREFSRELGIEYLRFMLVDNKDQPYRGAFNGGMEKVERFSDPEGKDYQPLGQDFQLVVDKAKEAKERKVGFLTHCTRGQRRSMFVNFALLLAVYGMSLREVIITGYKARPRTQLWDSMIEELVRIAKELRGEENADIPGDFFVPVEGESAKLKTLNPRYLSDAKGERKAVGAFRVPD